MAIDFEDRIIRSITEYTADNTWLQNIARALGVELERFRTENISDVEDGAHIETAEDASLTKHAEELLLVRRDGETDLELKRRIAFELSILRSSGTINQIQSLLAEGAWIEVGADWDFEQVQVKEFHDDGRFAFFRVEIDFDQLDDVGQNFVSTLIERSKPAGVGFELQSVAEFGYTDLDQTERDYEGSFGYVDIDSDSTDFTDVDGFSGVNQDIGGDYSSITILSLGVEGFGDVNDPSVGGRYSGVTVG